MKIIKSFEKFRLNESFRGLSPNNIKKGSIYDVEIEGENGEWFNVRELVLDINDKSILVIDSELAKKVDTEQFTLEFMENEGVEDPMLDESLIVYDILKDGKIETTLGFEVRFSEID